MSQHQRTCGRVFAAILIVLIVVAVLPARRNLDAQATQPVQPPARNTRDLLYVGGNGTEDYLNGPGVLVFDVKRNYRFVKRIPTWDFVASKGPDEVKGIAVSPVTGLLYVSLATKLGAIDLASDKMIWEGTPGGACCDRIAVSPDGKVIYAPAYGTPDARRMWHIIDATTGKLLKSLDLGEAVGPHNTIFSLDGSRVFMEGFSSRHVYIADPRTHTVVQKVGPFGNIVRPFTINGDATLIYATINDFLGFEIADVATGKVVQHIEVKGFGWDRSRILLHNMPSHGIALTPDEKELWLTDGVNGYLHVFDLTTTPPKQLVSIKSRSHPYWITVGFDGKFVYPSTGEVIDAASKKIVATLQDEYGRPVESEKLVEVMFAGGKIVRAVDQFGVGQVRKATTN